VTATALLKAIPHPTAQQVTEYMQGNICRCGTQPRIVAAVLRASAMHGHAAKEAS
jgi:isoquinoline 1-oxidoreductase subunit alpha